MIGSRRHPLRSFCAIFMYVSACLILTPSSFADGCYIPPVAYQKLPEIPLQRAILTWRGGTERMIVESTFKGEGDRFGWVIPLPAVPTSFEATTPGLLKTLAFNTQPEIVHVELGSIEDLAFGLFLAIIGFLLIFYACHAYANGGVSRERLCFGVFVGGSLIFIFMVFCIPNYLGGSAGSSAFSGISIEKQAQIGNYKVEVLKAETPEALGRWLSTNGFAPLPPEGMKIVADLIKEKWCFVTARLQREGEGLGRPHPMAITFPSAKLIYPMRLTALAGSPVYLDLFVIGEKQATCAPLKTDFCDRFDLNDQIIEKVPVYASQSQETSDSRGSRNKQPNIIAHPDAKRELWRGCVVTRLSGTLSPRQMRSDLIFKWKELKPFRRTLYTRQTAIIDAVDMALVILMPGLFIVLFWLGKGRRYPELTAFRAAFRRSLGIVALCGVAASGGVFFSTPTTDAIIKSRGSGSLRYIHQFFWDFTEEHPPQTVDALRQSLAREIKLGPASKYGYILYGSPTGEVLHEEDSPGNYVLHETENGIDIWIYSLNGALADGLFIPRQNGTVTSATK